MNEKSFSIRRLLLSDVNSVVRLFELVYKRRFSPESWNWKYKLNPAGFWGEQGDVCVAEDKNEIVGHLGSIPLKMKLGPETVTVPELLDGVTHPDYRGLGIFTALIKRVCLETQNRYPFIFGFPNELTYKTYLKLGWSSFRVVEFYKFLNYDRPLRSFSTSDLFAWSGKIVLKALRTEKYLSSSLRLKKDTGGPVEIREVERFPDEMDEFWKLVRSDYEAIVERTSTFLNWRFSKYFGSWAGGGSGYGSEVGSYQKYIARSVENGNIVGYMVLKKAETAKIKNILDIVDFHALPGEDKCVLNLIDMAISVCKEEGIDLLYCRIPRWHKYAKILYKLGFISIERMYQLTKIWQPELIFYQLSEGGKIPKMQKWFYALADSDWI